jgi:hypothetical protein
MAVNQNDDPVFKEISNNITNLVFNCVDEMSLYPKEQAIFAMGVICYWLFGDWGQKEAEAAFEMIVTAFVKTKEERKVKLNEERKIQ